MEQKLPSQPRHRRETAAGRSETERRAMGERLKLSVVIPTHNTRKLTLNCLAALWLCNPQPDEVIVVDDGSTDNTAQSVVRRYPRHIVVRLPSREGFTAAVNHGVSRASGDLVLLLNSDTEPNPKALGAVYEAFANQADLGVAGAVLHYPDGTPQWSGGRTPSALWCFALASGLPCLMSRFRVWRRFRPPSGSEGGDVDWVAGTAMVVRREVWSQAGPLDTGYRFYCQDLDLCCAAARSGWKVEILPDFRILHLRGGTITREDGSVGRQHPEYLWTDLLRFAAKNWGPDRARASARALRMGAALRVFGRSLASPLIGNGERNEWGDATTNYVHALRALDDQDWSGRDSSV